MKRRRRDLRALRNVGRTRIDRVAQTLHPGVGVECGGVSQKSVQRRTGGCDESDLGGAADRERVRILVHADQRAARMERAVAHENVELRSEHKRDVCLAEDRLRCRREQVREPHAQLVIVGEQPSRGARGEHRDARALGERAQRVAGTVPEATAPGDDDGSLGRTEAARDLGNIGRLRIAFRRVKRDLFHTAFHSALLYVHRQFDDDRTRPWCAGDLATPRDQRRGFRWVFQQNGPFRDRRRHPGLVLIAGVSLPAIGQRDAAGETQHGDPRERRVGERRRSVRQRRCVRHDDDARLARRQGPAGGHPRHAPLVAAVDDPDLLVVARLRTARTPSTRRARAAPARLPMRPSPRAPS